MIGTACKVNHITFAQNHHIHNGKARQRTLSN